MLKATLIIIICGLVCTGTPLFAAVVAIGAVSIFEVLYMAMHHGHHVWQFGSGFLLLNLTGEVSFLMSSSWLSDRA